MGNGLGTLGPCFSGDGRPVGAAAGNGALTGAEPNEESLGHSFVYVRPDGPPGLARSFSSASSSSRVHHSDEAAAPVAATTFRSISGAAVSANAATPLSTAPLLLRNDLACSSAASFESSSSFASIALQMPPRYSGSFSGPLSDRPCNSGPLSDRGGFASGHLDRGFHSGPLDHQRSVGGLLFSSGRLDDPSSSSSSSVSKRRALRRAERSRRNGPGFLRDLTKVISRTATKLRSIASSNKVSGKPNGSKGHNFTGNHDSTNDPSHRSAANGDDQIKIDRSGEESDSLDAQDGNLHWAQGKAGEDRVHVVVSEEHGWVFVGIYDGFNGPDATDYLLSNLYQSVHRELKGLLWDDSPNDPEHSDDSSQELDDDCCEEGRQGHSSSRAARKRRKSKLEMDTERTEMDSRLREQLRRAAMGGAVDHREVLKALSRALRKTEEAFLELTDKMVPVNPELALMGSCVLVVLMRGEDVFLMNVGDSRAVLARRAESDLWNLVGKATQDLDVIRDETLRYLEAYEDGDLLAVQLTMDHSTCVDEEVRRIRNEHPDDPSAIANNRVKGSLKVTRAFGAGYLKQPKLNNALLPVFRIDYKGALPYISCSPFLCHHRLVPKDKYLILSSDGLYQYFTNEEVVTEVEMFISMNPEGDPAQYLVEEVLNRAAREAGMDFHQLLEIPQGVRRKYHDDVSIIVISLEGRIWRSCV